MEPETAKKAAERGALPVKAFRLAGQKSPWLIAAEDLAKLIDKQKAAQVSATRAPRGEGLCTAASPSSFGAG
jgi:hypothetical protein